ncbi:ABC transporter permease [Aquicoccus porphyridii]|uniref:ABC transporter permease n=1 Tax=Aquicoccus porphyridii TaxID=1852029 RepID=A0A5A9YXN6_9RHOB|nr:ABC transporter permease [Aquicoccus porphyridii]KAA0909610.1 ABC transporter permease [Aquicoccus porphyridii]RAI51891.1 ABC transporter permease [Rhodobacteraceae bacterium AsT-22]
MGRFLLSRLLSAIPTVVIVTLMVFVLMRAIPGDPAALMLGDLAEPEQVAAMRAKMGHDQPLPMQYLLWIGDVLRGDFGHSIVNQEPILPLILTRFSVSATIVFAAVILAALVAVPAGMIAAWRQNRASDVAIVTAATLSLSIPSFWLGLMLLLVFGLWLNWLPIVGFVPVTREFWAGTVYLIMPVATLVLVESGSIARMARASTIEVARLDYITHARAKGLSERQVMWRHAFRNAFAPTWTLIGLILGSLLANIAVIETVFTIPGLGRLLIDSIYARDYPVVQGCLLFIALIYVAVNLLVDCVYPLLDPRVTA